MAAQQAGYETQKRLNEQMMEMMKRMYPNEVFLNIQDTDNVPRKFPRPRSSEISEAEEDFIGTSEDWSIGNFLGIYRGSPPSVYSEELSDDLVVLGVSSEI
uniref:Uncharacterized protein n=1 Tax=Brassica oleracea var. oleracea TaxID=109376 RepID=A0A0D3BHB7_BRAOL